MKHSRLPLIITMIVLIFFYLPILVLVINSFNASRFGSTWEGWSLRWYERLWQEREIWLALENSLIIAVQRDAGVDRARLDRSVCPASLSEQAAAVSLYAHLYAAGSAGNSHGHQPAAFFRCRWTWSWGCSPFL